jgi:hypothetical protein
VDKARDDGHWPGDCNGKTSVSTPSRQDDQRLGVRTTNAGDGVSGGSRASLQKPAASAQHTIDDPVEPAALVARQGFLFAPPNCSATDARAPSNLPVQPSIDVVFPACGFCAG